MTYFLIWCYFLALIRPVSYHELAWPTTDLISSQSLLIRVTSVLYVAVINDSYILNTIQICIGFSQIMSTVWKQCIGSHIPVGLVLRSMATRLWSYTCLCINQIYIPTASLVGHKSWLVQVAPTCSNRVHLRCYSWYYFENFLFGYKCSELYTLHGACWIL